MHSAFFLMCHSGRYNVSSVAYERARLANFERGHELGVKFGKRIRSQDERNRLSQKNRGRKLGKQAETHKQKISIALKGRKFSPQHRANLSKSSKECKRAKGLKRSIDHCVRQSERQQGRKRIYVVVTTDVDLLRNGR